MTQHYLLVEGINIYANVYDTDQLSVIRGSSFLYKDAIVCIAEGFQDKLTPISTGASSGLFEITDNSDVTKLHKDVIDRLNNHPDFQHLTFFVGTHPADQTDSDQTSLHAAKENLFTQLRFAQLQGLQHQPDKDLGTEPCSLSGSRISAPETAPKLKEKPVATAVFRRWLRGRNAKFSYYHDLIVEQDVVSHSFAERLHDYSFAENINILCADPNQPLDKDDKPTQTNTPLMYPKLAGKMAVIYIDGNNFGKQQRQYVQAQPDQIKAQKAFDNSIQTQRNAFLASILEELVTEEQQWGLNPLIDTDTKNGTASQKVLRLETLLWGGDEMTFIIPAWKGFDFLQRFFAFEWQLPNGKALTHAAGIVFCQAKTPIRIVEKLARSLVDDGVKAATDQQGNKIGRQQNGWDYVVLESIDYPSNESLSDYAAERYGRSLAGNRPPLLPCIADWRESEQDRLKTILSEQTLSRGQVQQIIKATLHSPPDKPYTSRWNDIINQSTGAYTPQEKAEQRLYQVSNNKSALKQLPECARCWFDLDFDDLQQRAWFWLHVWELWDYILPQCKGKQGGKT